MERTGPPARFTGLLAAFSAVLLAAGGLAATAPSAAAADSDLARNGGFEAGLDGWSCTGGSGAAVSTPVHSGTSALRATPAGSDNAKCSQSVTVKPDSTYTLSAWVQGSYVYLGADGTGTTDVSTWTQSAAGWQQLTTTFKTGPSTTSVTVYTHGWYGTPAYYADDLTLVGPGGDPVALPATPTGLKTGTTTASSVALSWTGSTGATGYNVYQGGTKVLSVTGTSATVTGLAASTAYSFQVAAANSAGESAKS
ncbi:carbohydrate binding domain-containing protein, partial [Streptomyces sp. Ncost-T10-10d]|uniref:carbohydrate binding domain-containing protein n=1 Tax=Streptomyces sp. Ncost-T10-10d TaxID=1839774 RepID=UPI00081E6ECA